MTAEANLDSVKLHARSSTSHRLQALRDILRIVFRGTETSHATGYRFHIHEPYSRDIDKGLHKGAKNARMLSWWCFNPGIAMEEFSRLGVRSVILTSGTLAPLDSFALELKLPFEVRLENPHVIGPDQIWVGVVSSGPSGRSLNSSYRTRDSLEYKIELGNTIVNFARIVPDGLLVFFPSYYLLNQCIEGWQTLNSGASAGSSTIWERICKHKQPVVEPKESALFNHANEDFLTKLNDATSSGAVFFAVCRGKVSEGLDFADKAGRAVVVTGIPYAMKTDPKVRLKREYLDEQARLQTNKTKALTGEEWYVQQASRAVNQAVGRVIRHRDDYGAIILCDERFAQGNTQNQMSLWLRPHIKCYSKFGDAAFTLTRFFRDKVNIDSFKKAFDSQFTKEVRDITGNSCQEKTLRAIYSNIQAQGVFSTQGEESMAETGIFGKKLTRPSVLCLGSSTDAGSSRPEKSVVAMLANCRGNSSTKDISTSAIIPANRAVGSEDGVVRMMSVSNFGTNIDRNIAMNKTLGSISETDVVDLATPAPSTKYSFFQGRKVAYNIDHGHIDRQRVSGNATQTNVVVKKSQMSSYDDMILNNNASFTMEDKKSINAADFLKEVKAHLSAPEYKGFLDCMKGLKQQIMSMTTLLETVASLFSAPERIFLLHRFGDFVPRQHRELYEKFLAAKCAVVEELSGRCLPGDKITTQAETILGNFSTCPGLHGFPLRSRKRLTTADSTQSRTEDAKKINPLI